MTATPSLRVLVVEDDAIIRQLLVRHLTEHGLQATGCASLAAAREYLGTNAVDLLVLDLGLPDGDGIAFIAELRAWSPIGIVVLSARNQERDKILALDSGADDYLTKPFSAAELLARIRAQARRTPNNEHEVRLDFGDIRIDFAARRVTRSGELLHLTPTEFRTLAVLIAQRGKVLTYRHLLRDVWGEARCDQHHYVRIVVGHLRAKLERDPTQPRYLITELGVGYRWQP